MPVMKKPNPPAVLPGPLQRLSEMMFPPDDLGLDGVAAPLAMAGRVGKGLAKLGMEAAEQLTPRRAAPAMETLGEINPEFTPVGGEFLYAKPAPAPPKPYDPYLDMMWRGLGGKAPK